MNGFLTHQHFQQLIDALLADAWTCIGPVVRNDVIEFHEFTHVDELPRGVEDRQSPGHYELIQAEHNRYFSWASTSQTVKPLTFAPYEPLWRCSRSDTGELVFETHQHEPPAIAVLGIHACDLAALKLQRQHFVDKAPPDDAFKARDDRLFIIAVECSHAADTCFCASTGDGPNVRDGYDIVLHELDDGFLVRSGSKRGDAILDNCTLQDIRDLQMAQAAKQTETVIQRQQRSLPAGDVPQRLMHNLQHSHWHDIAQRCLACGNCTAVCPTCFCHQQHDDYDITAGTSTHSREWSSCFTHDHGYLAGFNLRSQIDHRYRQWLTHKFASWHDQYGRSGCTGCGRCITWCPVGIDVTRELAVLCDDE